MCVCGGSPGRSWPPPLAPLQVKPVQVKQGPCPKPALNPEKTPTPTPDGPHVRGHCGSGAASPALQRSAQALPG